MKLALTLDEQALAKAEKTSNARFNKILNKWNSLQQKTSKIKQKFSEKFNPEINMFKSFGKGAVKVGGGLSILSVIIAKLFGNVEQLNTTIDSTLDKFKAISMIGKNLRLPVEDVARLQKTISLGKGAGVDESNIVSALSSFRDVIQLEKSSPQKSSIEQFTNEDLITEFQNALYSIQSLKDNKLEQKKVTEVLFGGGSYESLLPLIESNIGDLAKEIGLSSLNNKNLNKDIGNLANRKNQENIGVAKREINDINKKSTVITSETIKQKQQYEQNKLNAENVDLTKYDNSVKIENSIMEMVASVKKLLELAQPLISGLANSLTKIASAIETIVTYIKSSKLAKILGF